MWKSWCANAAGYVGGQRNIALILSLVGLLAIPAAPLHAVIILGTDDSTLNAPSDDPGWASVGTTASSLGCEYLGNGWVLTAAHTRQYNNDGTFNESAETATFNGVTYNCVIGSSIRLQASPTDSSPIDLSLYRVADQNGHTPGMNSLSISSASPAVQDTVMGVGFGYDRNPLPTYWNYGSPSWTQISGRPPITRVISGREIAPSDGGLIKSAAFP